MEDEDLERIRNPRTDWAPNMRCAACGQAPTCPQLTDEAWHLAWELTRVRLGFREPQCTGRTHIRTAWKCHADGSWHSGVCEIQKGLRELLCFDCVERALGRRLELGDLMPCVGNYAHFVMQTRSLASGTRR